MFQEYPDSVPRAFPEYHEEISNGNEILSLFEYDTQLDTDLPGNPAAQSSGRISGQNQPGPNLAC